MSTKNRQVSNPKKKSICKIKTKTKKKTYKKTKQKQNEGC